MATSTWYQSDRTLRALLDRDLSKAERERAEPLLQRAALLCEEQVAPLSVPADRFGPRLITHDRLGERVDQIEYHPAYPAMQRLAYGELGLVAMKYGSQPVSQTLGFAAAYLFGQAESGLFCPVCMTDGAARVLTRFAAPALRDELVAKLTSRDLATLGTGAMFLTEKQGGSDVGQTATVAKQDGDRWRLWGDKWFCSNVDAGVILALARPEGAGPGTRGLGLFAVEPRLRDGSRNAMRIHRIKDKLGARSMPTGEVSFDGAEARLVGEAGQGFHYMTEMMNLSRLYNAIASVAIMRRALVEGRAWVESRVAFGKRAAEHPLCIEALADLGAETAAALQLVFDGVRHLGAWDAAGDGPKGENHRKLVRILTPLMKYYSAKGAVWAASEGMELIGGNGYIEEFVTARLLRDAQVLPIWEGTTNICVLDSVRAMEREGCAEPILGVIQGRLESVTHPLLAPLKARAGAELAELVAGLGRRAQQSPEAVQHHARRFCDRLVVTYQVAHALAESQRLEAVGDGGRDALVAARLVHRHLDRGAPLFEGGHLDRARLEILLGDRSASIAEVGTRSPL